MMVELELGRLNVHVRRQTWPLDALCCFACRRNPRRPFLVVSKILGKHIPCDPGLLVKASNDLVGLLPQLPSPACFIGMAETATSLSQTVFERWLHRNPDTKGIYTQTTRYRLERADLAFLLEEVHSHATTHRVYLPTADIARERFNAAQTLVIVDDEFTTGNTAVNLALAYAKRNRTLKRIALVCLTNWMSNQAAASVARHIEQSTGASVSIHALLSGELQFTDVPKTARPWASGDESLESAAVAAANGPNSPRDECLPWNTGRLGVTGDLQFDFEAMTDGLEIAENVAVVGTGEYMYPPSRLARWLAQRGHRVSVQSSTRSPIVGGGVIASSLEFPDNYFDGIRNFLYNHGSAVQQANRTSLLCYETQPIPERHDLANHLGAKMIFPGQYLIS